MKTVDALILTFASASLLAALPAEAALKSSKAASAEGGSSATFKDPKPDSRDLALPMPDGSEMIFRAVAIPAQNLLYDKKFRMGVNDVDDDRAFYERRLDSWVGGPFLRSNLPASWAKRLPADEARGYCYYFIGKYEITVSQWQAVMGKAPAAGEKPDHPKANISWFDMQRFLEKYNEWLLSKHHKALPQIDGVPGYVRLPTEEEWEFAARGGNLPPERLDFDDFPLAPGKKVEDYAVFGSRFSDTASVGTKQPNPLGLYDMAGNVAEMVQSSFRFTVADRSGSSTVRRLHGTQGGLMSKGGSFISAEERDVFPGRRVEMKMYVKDSSSGGFIPYRARSVGARLVVSSLNVPGVRRANTLTEDAKKLGAGKPDAPRAEKPKAEEKSLFDGFLSRLSDSGVPDQAVKIDPDGSPLTEVDKIIQAASSGVMKKNLVQLRRLLEDYNTALEREHDSNVTKTLRSVVYEASALRNYAFRCWYMNDIKKGMSKAARTNPKVLAKERELVALVDASTNLYLTRVAELALIDPILVKHKAAQLKKEYSGEDYINVNMRQNIEAAEQHIAFLRTYGVEKLTQPKIWEDVIPEAIRKAFLLMRNGE